MLSVLAPSTMRISSIVVLQTLCKLLYFYSVFSLYCWTALPSLDTLSPCSTVKKKKEREKYTWQIREKLQHMDEFLRRRQIAHMICEHFREHVPPNLFWNSFHCVSTSLRGDDVQGFETKLDEILLSMLKTSKDDILERKCKNQNS